MVQGSYPRYHDEEKERLIKADEEAQFQVVEVKGGEYTDTEDNDDPTPTPPPENRCRWARWCRKNKNGGERKKRPLWRRILRFTMSVFLFMFVWHAFVKPLLFFGFGGFDGFGCDHMSYQDVEPVTIGDTPHHKPKMHYTFPDAKSSFFVKEERNTHVPTKVNVFGAVNVFPSDNDDTTVDFHVSVSDTRLWETIKIEPKKDGVIVSADAFSLVEQFINLTAVVRLSKSEDMKKFEVSARTLDVKLWEGVDNDFDATRVQTVSGDVHVHGTHKSSCVKFRSVSGDIKGTFDLIRGVVVKTVSGDIDIAVKPVELDEKKAFLATDSVSGNAKVHVIHPLNKRNLKSWHRTTSGDIKVRYPEEWQGRLKLTSKSGDFTLIGKNTKVIEKKKGLGGKIWKVIKGNGVSKAKIQTVSGDVKVSIGDE